MKYTVRSSVDKHEFQLPRKAEFTSEFSVEMKGKNIAVRILETNSDGSLRLVMVNNRVIPVQVDRRGDGLPERVYLNGVSYRVEIEKVESTRFKPPATVKQVSGQVRAELPGQITSLFVEVGDEVEKGQTLGILEAMKMENELTAPRAGKVRQISASPGKAVMKGDLILELS
ncbi:MAG TPA: biotin/lipoyl-containing protein [Fibrobacteraceae bacterium]|nr:biotin/lipoyl-containing protein [Fibrobacteraceae bacterium]